ncbi:chloride channel protein [Sulfuricella sp. T08]|uniref:chloride channel protein n=1 Tax=Sulfuricella sp. T08 TaxID=1632857 RepID=UPI0006179921|nr:chloride channel protein [Sulfuricella sp. T08]GAO35296.1 chloride channel protein [Sulfuricella sp. T08]
MSKRYLNRSTHVWLSIRHWKRRLLFWTGAICVGAAAVFFARGSEESNQLFHRIIEFSPYLPLIIAPAGLALVAYITRRFFPGSQGSGIPQTIAALKMQDSKDRESVLSLRIALGKIPLTLIALLSGASVGREGPTVQIGAAIMHSLGKLGRFPRLEMERGLILAGGAAGVAAAFNTPLAGVVFAIEEMSRSFEEKTNGIVLTAVIVAGMTSLAMMGNYTYFGYTDASLDLDHGWIAVLVCGVTGGLLGGLFSRILIAFSRGIPGRIGALMKERPIVFAALCGFVLALIGLLSGSTTYGTGYQEAQQIISEGAPLPETYGILKMLATIVSYVSGIPGGIFAPSLAIGAGFGSNLAEIMPYAPAGAVVILGMVAYFAGVVQAPITAFVIVMEMTNNHAMLLPLMAASIIASATSRLICHKPLYKSLADNFLQRSTSTAVPSLLLPDPPQQEANGKPPAP